MSHGQHNLSINLYPYFPVDTVDRSCLFSRFSAPKFFDKEKKREHTKPPHNITLATNHTNHANDKDHGHEILHERY